MLKSKCRRPKSSDLKRNKSHETHISSRFCAVRFTGEEIRVARDVMFTRVVIELIINTMGEHYLLSIFNDWRVLGVASVQCTPPRRSRDTILACGGGVLLVSSTSMPIQTALSQNIPAWVVVTGIVLVQIPDTSVIAVKKGYEVICIAHVEGLQIRETHPCQVIATSVSIVCCM